MDKRLSKNSKHQRKIQKKHEKKTLKLDSELTEINRKKTLLKALIEEEAVITSKC